MLIPRLHPQSIMARSSNDGLYSNLYDKDMNLMRKLMNLDEFQCPSSGNNNLAAVNSDASKQFHPYTNGGIFNGKMLTNSAANFAFPYDKQQHPHQHMNGGMRNHDGLLKQCYDFPATTATAKTEPLDDNFNAGFATKKSSSQNALFNSPSGGGFMNQFAHHDYSNHQAFTAKINEINNNNNNSGGGIVVKLENGGNDYVAMQQQLAKSEILCPRGIASTMVVSKTEPNEFRSSSCKDNNNHVDNNEDERKTSLHSHDHDSNDGFTQL